MSTDLRAVMRGNSDAIADCTARMTELERDIKSNNLPSLKVTRWSADEKAILTAVGCLAGGLAMGRSLQEHGLGPRGVGFGVLSGFIWGMTAGKVAECALRLYTPYKESDPRVLYVILQDQREVLLRGI